MTLCQIRDSPTGGHSLQIPTLPIIRISTLPFVRILGTSSDLFDALVKSEDAFFRLEKLIATSSSDSLFRKPSYKLFNIRTHGYRYLNRSAKPIGWEEAPRTDLGAKRAAARTFGYVPLPHVDTEIYLFNTVSHVK